MRKPTAAQRGIGHDPEATGPCQWKMLAIGVSLQQAVLKLNGRQKSPAPAFGQYGGLSHAPSRELDKAT